MYRGLPPRYIFLCLFFINLCQKIIFHRLFCVLSGRQFKGFSYYESLILCTWITECMRCGKSGAPFFRPQGEIFRDKMRPDVRAFARVFPHETARVHRGDTEERSGGGFASAARGQRVDWGKTKMKSQGRGAFRKSRAAPLIRQRPLAPLMTCNHVLA